MRAPTDARACVGVLFPSLSLSLVPLLDRTFATPETNLQAKLARFRCFTSRVASPTFFSWIDETGIGAHNLSDSAGTAHVTECNTTEEDQLSQD